jgi:copper ion binding protein
MSSMKETVLEVEGMSCSSCVRHVEGALRGIDGVTRADVDLGAKRARVQHDPAKASVEQMIAAVVDAGYECRVTAG